MIDADCILLAAGMSQRMGQNKMLLPLGHQILLHYAYELVLENFSQVYLVQGAIDFRDYLPLFPHVHFLTNTEYTHGMTSSLRLGLEASKKDYTFIHLGDLPFVSLSTLEALYAKRETASFVAPLYHEKKGHPVCISQKAKQFFLKNYSQDLKPQAIWSSVSSTFLQIEDKGSVFDIDTPERYTEAQILYKEFLEKAQIS